MSKACGGKQKKITKKSELFSKFATYSGLSLASALTLFFGFWPWVSLKTEYIGLLSGDTNENSGILLNVSMVCLTNAPVVTNRFDAELSANGKWTPLEPILITDEFNSFHSDTTFRKDLSGDDLQKSLPTITREKTINGTLAFSTPYRKSELKDILDHGGDVRLTLTDFNGWHHRHVLKYFRNENLKLPMIYPRANIIIYPRDNKTGKP